MSDETRQGWRDVYEAMARLLKGERKHQPDATDIVKITDLVDQLGTMQDVMFQLEEKLEQVTKRRDLLRFTHLPDAMAEAGLGRMCELADGRKLTLRPHVRGVLTEKAIEWMVDNGHADVIKHDITAKFTKGEDEIARKLVEELTAGGYTIEDKTHVPWNTLGAFIRERLEEGDDIPLDDFEATVGQEARVK